MTNLIKLEAGRKPPVDLSAKLREIADAVDRNEIKDFVAAYIQGDNFEFFYAASLTECVLLSTLLQRSCIDRMKE